MIKRILTLSTGTASGNQGCSANASVAFSKKAFCFLLFCGLLLVGRSAQAQNTPPNFYNGHTQTATVCSGSLSLNTYLAAYDPNTGQTETWTLVTAPLHGSAAVAYTTTSTGGILIPSGLSYTPTSGFTGTDVIKVSVKDTGSIADTTTITITVSTPVSAGIIIGPSAVCQGSNINLTDASPGGVWSASNGNITVAGGVVTGNNVGTSIVSYSVTGACGTATAQSTITVYPVPDPIVGSNSMCKGNTMALSDDVSGGAWTSSLTSVASVDGIGNVFGVSTGSATISYTIGGVCSQTLVVSVAPPLSLINGPMNVCVGNVITLSDPVIGGTWSTTATTASVNSSTGDVTGIGAGTATISYAVSSGCMVSSIININRLPNPIVLSPTSVICYSDKSVTASDEPGGTWTSTLVTVDIRGYVSAYSVGSGYLTYTLPTGCAITTPITVNPLPSMITGPKQVCTGAIDALSDAAVGGTWTTTDPALLVDYYSGGVYGNSKGTSVVTYMLPTGCYTLDTVTVVQSPSPVIGLPDVCVNSITTLSDTVTGGFWSVAAGGNASINKFTGAVTGLLAGSTTVTYTTGIGCALAVPFTVWPLPTPYVVNGGGGYCTGGTGSVVGLSGSAAGVKYYLYNGFVTVVDSMIGTGSPFTYAPETFSGRYTVIAKDLATGCRNIMDDTVLISVDPILTPIVNITVIPGDTVCSGTSVTYTATSLSGGSAPKYQWKVNGADMGSGTLSYTYVPVNGDLVGVELTSNATCVSTTSAFGFVTMDVITPVLPDLSIGVDPGINVPIGTLVTFTANVANLPLLTKPTYQWLKSGNPIPGAVTPTYSTTTLSDTNTVSCVVTSGGKCSQTARNSVHMNVFDPGGHSTGIQSTGTGNLNISVIPNPSNGAFTVKGDVGTGVDEEVSLQLTNMLGQVMYSGRTLAKGGSIDTQVQITNTIAPGTYLLNVRSSSANKVFHIVIE